MNFSNITQSVPEKLNGLLDAIPKEVSLGTELLSAGKLIFLVAAVFLIAGVVIKTFFGRDSSLNRALSASLGILAMYAVTVVIYVLNPWKLSTFLSPLPFAFFGDRFFLLIPFRTTEFSVLCGEVLSLVILCFLVNLLDTLLPRGKTILGWFILRVLLVAFSMVLNLVSRSLIARFLPELLVQYAPIVLLAVLFVFLFLGIIKLVLGVVITALNPLLGGIYAFFFSNFIGKQISKSVLSAIMLCGLFYFLEWAEWSIFTITPSALLSYVPFAAVTLLLWYQLGHEM